NDSLFRGHAPERVIVDQQIAVQVQLIGQFHDDHRGNVAASAASRLNAAGDGPAMSQFQIETPNPDFHGEYEIANEPEKQPGNALDFPPEMRDGNQHLRTLLQRSDARRAGAAMGPVGSLILA